MILADEVGLGKTIEASIVIAQRWAEREMFREGSFDFREAQNIQVHSV